MCFLCGFGLFPWIALSTCNHHNEHYHEEPSNNRDVIEILKERYARGEITREEFLEIRRDLKYQSMVRGEIVMMWFGWGWGFMFFAPLCLALVGVAIYYLLIYSSRPRYHRHYPRVYQPSRSSIEILRERYARGEISREEFLEMRKELES